MNTAETLAWGSGGGIIAFALILILPALTKIFGTKVEVDWGQLALKIAVGLGLALIFGAAGAVAAVIGGPDTAGKALILGVGGQAVLKEVAATGKVSQQTPPAGGQAAAANPLVHALASSGQSVLYKNWQ